VIKTLDLSFNNYLTKPFYEVLAEYIDDPATKLKKLVLEGNKMGDSNLEILCNTLKYNTSVTYVNFSKNEITDHGLKFICNMLYYNNTINVLFLHWNRILGKGGA
jgi:Ran GTPase-activating protein (RanGAP) involved in mRNA processing and transport